MEKHSFNATVISVATQIGELRVDDYSVKQAALKSDDVFKAFYQCSGLHEFGVEFERSLNRVFMHEKLVFNRGYMDSLMTDSIMELDFTGSQCNLKVKGYTKDSNYLIDFICLQNNQGGALYTYGTRPSFQRRLYSSLSTLLLQSQLPPGISPSRQMHSMLTSSFIWVPNS